MSHFSQCKKSLWLTRVDCESICYHQFYFKCDTWIIDFFLLSWLNSNYASLCMHWKFVLCQSVERQLASFPLRLLDLSIAIDWLLWISASVVNTAPWNVFTPHFDKSFSWSFVGVRAVLYWSALQQDFLVLQYVTTIKCTSSIMRLDGWWKRSVVHIALSLLWPLTQCDG